MLIVSSNSLLKKLFLFLLFLLFSFNLHAADLSLKSKYALIVEEKSGTVLYSKNVDSQLYPASLTKLIVLYIIFDKLKTGVIHLNDEVVVSKNAFTKGHYTTGGSSMFLRDGEKVTVEDLIKGIIVVSGNDATIALAEYVSGSEDNFINEMNEKSKELGLSHTHFNNTDGIHDVNHYSTAQDLVILSRRIIDDFPDYYPFFKILELTHSNIKQYNRNKLLFASLPLNIVVDGLKTGHTDVSKYSLIFSAIQPDTNFRVVGILSGAPSELQRTKDAKSMVNWVYSNYKKKTLYHKGDLIASIPVVNATLGNEDVIAQDDISFITLNNTNLTPKITLTHKNYINGKIDKGDILAVVSVSNNGDYDIDYKLTAKENVEKRSGFVSFLLSPYYAVKKIFS